MTYTAMKKPSISRILFVVLLLFSVQLMAGDIPPKPNPPRLVNDFAGILTTQQIKNLEFQLRYFHDTTSNQIVVVTVKSLNGMDPAMFATELGQKWGVGQKKFDNGVVILVKPKYRNSRGQAFIAVGYGLEPVIPDATAKQIVEYEMIPSFKQGNYYDGIRKATATVMKLAAGEITAKGYNKMHKSSPLTALLPFVVFILIFLLIRVSNARSYSVGKGTSLWTAFMLGSMLGGSSHSGSWNDFSGGGGGGGFGGGFSGFGGGGFGGGGAGGSW
jgi:uncharacterized protein